MADEFFSLKGQIAIVTGGGQGIGEGIARRLHSAGARVAILDLNEGTAKSVAQSIDGLASPMRCIFGGIGAASRLHRTTRSGSDHDPGEQCRDFGESGLPVGTR